LPKCYLVRSIDVQLSFVVQGKEDVEQQGVSSTVATEYDEALTTLRNKLMALEITLVDQLEVSEEKSSIVLLIVELFLGHNTNVRTKFRRNGIEFH
jgi:hypothetical protein